MIESVAGTERIHQPLDLVLAIADEYMIEAGQLLKRASLLKGPANGTADHAFGVWVSALQIGADTLQVGGILIDAAKKKNIGLFDVCFGLKTAVG